MKRALLGKLQDQTGASMLLALLFLLICSTVSAVIFMASMSNIGKQRSNLEEHQAYLALSSAINLISDDIAQAEYRGTYECGQMEDADGNTVRYFTQTTGTYSGELGELLLEVFDGIFAQTIRESEAIADIPVDQVTTIPSSVREYKLNVKPQTGTELDEQTVELTVKVMNLYDIQLTVALGEYQLHVDLTPNTATPNLPSDLPDDGAFETQPLRWKSGSVTRLGDGEEIGG